MDRKHQSQSKSKTSSSHCNDDDYDDDGNPERKRIRLNDDQKDNGVAMKIEIPSMESLLAVPPEILYGTVGPPPSRTDSSRSMNGKPNSRRRALLTGSEAEHFLNITCIAQELDVLAEVAEHALEQQRYCREYKQKILELKNNNPFLLPLVPIVHFLEKQVKPELQYIQQRISTLLQDLSVSASTLRQLAEQNWTLSDSLLQAFDCTTTTTTVASYQQNGQSLIEEKQHLAELEEEVVSRIEILITMTYRSEHRSIQPDTWASESSRKNLFPSSSSRGGGGTANPKAAASAAAAGTSPKTMKFHTTESLADIAFQLFPVITKQQLSKVKKEESNQDAEESQERKEPAVRASSAQHDDNDETMKLEEDEDDDNRYLPSITQPNSQVATAILRDMHNHHESQNSLGKKSKTAAEALATLGVDIDGTRRY